jgi:hypothetical protein
MTGRPLPEQRRRRSIVKADRQKFLDALSAGWAVRHAAKLTGVGFQRWYALREQDEAFARAWAEAAEQGTQALENEARRRAVDGYEEFTHDGEGNLLRRVHRYDGALLQTLLKGRRPEVYKERPAIEVENHPVRLVIVSAFGRPDIELEPARELPEAQRALPGPAPACRECGLTGGRHLEGCTQAPGARGAAPVVQRALPAPREEPEVAPEDPPPRSLAGYRVERFDPDPDT